MYEYFACFQEPPADLAHFLGRQVLPYLLRLEFFYAQYRLINYLELK